MTTLQHKYLAEVLGPLPVGDRSHRVHEGYLFAGDGGEWRLRFTRGIGLDTSRPAWHTTVRLGRGVMRREYQLRLPAVVGRLLGRFVPQWLLVRRADIDGWSVDVFDGALEGLVLAECTVPTRETPLPPLPSNVRLRHKVTYDRTLANRNLARLSPEEQGALVLRLEPVRYAFQSFEEPTLTP